MVRKLCAVGCCALSMAGVGSSAGSTQCVSGKRATAVILSCHLLILMGKGNAFLKRCTVSKGERVLCLETRRTIEVILRRFCRLKR